LSAAAEELSGQAAQLHQMMRRFTLRRSAQEQYVAPPSGPPTFAFPDSTASGWNEFDETSSLAIVSED